MELSSRLVLLKFLPLNLEKVVSFIMKLLMLPLLLLLLEFNSFDFIMLEWDPESAVGDCKVLPLKSFLGCRFTLLDSDDGATGGN